MTATADSLTGADVAAVVARLGSPLACTLAGDELRLAYRGADDSVVDDAIVLVDGVVVRERVVRRSPPTLHGYWLGQPIERVQGCFGPLVALRAHPVLQELQFANWRVAVHEGRVVMATPGVVTAAS